jgi:hypothetical protein
LIPESRSPSPGIRISRDKDILDLANPDDADGMRLRAIAPDVRIVGPSEFIREIRASVR